MEWLDLATNLLCSEGPIVVDLNIYKHALGCYKPEELEQLGVKEENDIVVIGEKGEEEDPKFITLKDLNDFFDTVLSRRWPEGRSYYMNGIYNKYQCKWVAKEYPNCDYFVNWDS